MVSWMEWSRVRREIQRPNRGVPSTSTMLVPGPVVFTLVSLSRTRSKVLVPNSLGNSLRGLQSGFLSNTYSHGLQNQPIWSTYIRPSCLRDPPKPGSQSPEGQVVAGMVHADDQQRSDRVAGAKGALMKRICLQTPEKLSKPAESRQSERLADSIPHQFTEGLLRSSISMLLSLLQALKVSGGISQPPDPAPLTTGTPRPSCSAGAGLGGSVRERLRSRAAWSPVRAESTVLSCGVGNRTNSSNLVAMTSNLRALASKLVAMAFNLIVMASNLMAMAFNLIVMASDLIAMAFNLMGRP